MFEVDQIHAKLDPMKSRMVYDVWKNKYKWGNEQSVYDSFRRVADAIYANDKPEHREAAYEAMRALLWLPGGRIIAGAGTNKRVTLMNCYVNETVEDSMEGILRAQANTALTLQQGGGIGTDFSTLRPEGATLVRTHSKASGPLPFMHMWDATSRTIRSAGERRGAMMGTMSDTHPDLPKFIDAKHTKGALEQFNVSILVSDAFMNAVREDEDWYLHFPIRPWGDRDPELVEADFTDDDGIEQFVYSKWRARDLWKKITESTYEYSEPGVIFIDRINDLNNLWYCEKIRCTNPCGEQPLPPHGTCNLGHINLARVVRNPFTDTAQIDWRLIHDTVRVGVRFLDNVIDATHYPLPQQEAEQRNKRRLGLGFTGLADMLAQLGVRYGSPDAVRITEEVVRVIATIAYNTSIDLAIERGTFPYHAREYTKGDSFAATMLPDELKARIEQHGIRNSLLMTVAPTGTGSILYGNVSSGGEPTFLHMSQRRVLKPTDGFKDEWETYIELGYTAQLWCAFKNIDPQSSPSIPFETAADLTVEDHIVMQAAAQRWIDASISKTVNVPKDMPYEQFVKVYDLAYSLGCKGCTTYRPSDIRGSVLSAPGTSPSTAIVESAKPRERPEALNGTTYKIKWPSMSSSLYLTVNSDDEGMFEVFFNSKDARNHDWTTALSIMVTSLYRKGGDIDFLARELQQVQALNDAAFKDGQLHTSLPAYIGYILERHNAQGKPKQLEKPVQVSRCPKCAQNTLVHKEGCKSCTSCDFTSCG
jgi:ribonucleoside-diphosphate reductase alpha chain